MLILVSFKTENEPNAESSTLMALQQDSLILLPSLCHLEHGLSTHWQQELASIKDQTFTDDEIRALPHYEDSVKTRYQALDLGFGIVLNSATGTITSLKLKNTLVWVTPGTAKVPVSLQHLDLEINTGREALWNRRLRKPKQLKTLRLKTMHGGGRCTEYQKEKSRVAHMDDLFINPYNANDRCFFSELKSLELLVLRSQTQGPTHHHWKTSANVEDTDSRSSHLISKLQRAVLAPN